VADLDQAVVQLVDGLGILVRIVVELLVLVDVDVEVDRAGLVGGRWLVVSLVLGWRGWWRDEAVDGEIDGAVDDRAPGAQLAGGVVDGKHRVLPVLGQEEPVLMETRIHFLLVLHTTTVVVPTTRTQDLALSKPLSKLVQTLAWHGRQQYFTNQLLVFV